MRASGKRRGRALSALENRSASAAYVTYAALAISIAALVVGVAAYLKSGMIRTVTSSVTTTANTTFQITGFNITSGLITPPLTLADAPVITAVQPAGSRLTGINSQLNSSELAAINSAPASYFQTAGEMYLNGTLPNVGAGLSGFAPNKIPSFIVNGRPSVIYVGSITCIFCGENRWAMALALSRFGNFSSLFKGYSAWSDYDVPTLYWSPAHYNASSTELGSFFNSTYINFIAIEDANPITGGFVLNQPAIMQQRVNSSGNTAYIDAFKFINELGTNVKTAFQGTPYTIWGSYEVGGADAVDFFGSSPTAMASMTHDQVLQQLQHPNNTAAWSEYAAADVYIALTCASISNKAPVCSLPAIQAIESRGY